MIFVVVIVSAVVAAPRAAMASVLSQQLHPHIGCECCGIFVLLLFVEARVKVTWTRVASSCIQPLLVFCSNFLVPLVACARTWRCTRF